jgi:hypothetical protein
MGKRTVAMHKRTVRARINLGGIRAQTVRLRSATVRSPGQLRCLSSPTVRLPGETVYLAAELGRQSRKSKMPRL